MSVIDPERARKARVFRAKSEDSFDSAELSRQAGKHRSACNRAYYAVYQLLNAELWDNTTFEARDMNRNFPDNWLHNNLAFMTEKVVTLVPATKAQRKEWVDIIFDLLELRKVADYDPNTDQDVNEECAKNTLLDARTLIQIITTKNPAAGANGPSAASSQGGK